MRMFTRFVVVAAMLVVANVKAARADAWQDQVDAVMSQITVTARSSDAVLGIQLAQKVRLDAACQPFTVLPLLLGQAVALNNAAHQEILNCILQQGFSIFYITRAIQLHDAGDLMNASAALMDASMANARADASLAMASSEVGMADWDFNQWLNTPNTPLPGGPDPMLP